MAKNIFRTGKQTRPKTAIKGKRYHCAKCRKRSPKPVKTPAPWYCPRCRGANNTVEEQEPRPYPCAPEERCDKATNSAVGP